MTKRMVLYEAGKILLLFAELAGLLCIAYGLYRVAWYCIQIYLAPLNYETMLQFVDSIPEKVSFLSPILRKFISPIGKSAAIRGLLRSLLITAIGFSLLVPARIGLRRLEYRFKQIFMPRVLRDTFSDFTYEAKRRNAAEETLCEMGLLSSVERYYTANRLEGLYRDCWVASQEIICGGVYAGRYSSYKVKVRGQWLTIRLNADFEGTLILEGRNTKNRFSHRTLPSRMCELEVDHQELAARFACYTDTIEDARSLLTVEMAEKILSMLERYPDLCIFFRQGCMHILIRRRSFDRRWELACPFCYPQLRREAKRLYNPLLDFTDMLLE